MWANNETGVLFPVDRFAEICRSRGVLYHCDAVQAAGKVEIDVRKIPADYLSLTGHKFHAPKGIGALYVRRKSPFSPLIWGGHQERNRRGGTENVGLIVSMGKAAEPARKHLAGHEKKVPPLRSGYGEVTRMRSSRVLPSVNERSVVEARHLKRFATQIQ